LPSFHVRLRSLLRLPANLAAPRASRLVDALQDEGIIPERVRFQMQYPTPLA
jgi:hypothetical protein